MRGVSGATLHRRVRYGGKKGRSAARRLKRWEAQLLRSGFAEQLIASFNASMEHHLGPVFRMFAPLSRASSTGGTSSRPPTSSGSPPSASLASR